MKLFYVCIGGTALLFAAFLFSMSSSSTILTTTLCCAWTPLAWLTGFAFKRANIKVDIPA